MKRYRKQRQKNKIKRELAKGIPDKKDLNPN